ncbi:hypothetical protein XENOCAPTIV_018316 [Xenoophorus captivus]|uniref:Transposase n=1 Tax=Xenoophorus captivus TaxID=1517983 RepID=A0ABV0S7S6_9TELE
MEKGVGQEMWRQLQRQSPQTRWSCAPSWACCSWAACFALKESLRPACGTWRADERSTMYLPGQEVTVDESLVPFGVSPRTLLGTAAQACARTLVPRI